MRKSVYGWLTPAGEFLPCSVLGHIQVVLTDETMRQIANVEQYEAELAAIKASCQESAEREGRSNAEWHVYKMATDDAHAAMLHHLFAAKFLRVVTIDDDTITFEGTPGGIVQLFQKAKDLAEEHGMFAVFERRGVS